MPLQLGALTVGHIVILLHPVTTPRLPLLASFSRLRLWTKGRSIELPKSCKARPFSSVLGQAEFDEGVATRQRTRIDHEFLQQREMIAPFFVKL